MSNDLHWVRSGRNKETVEAEAGTDYVGKDDESTLESQSIHTSSILKQYFRTEKRTLPF